MGDLCYPLIVFLLALPLLEGTDESQDQPVFSRIIGGQDAQKNEWPWQVSVQKNGNHHCGGSLISAQWVVSAAHCFKSLQPLSQYSVVLGAHQLSSSANQRSEVQQIICHPNYNDKTRVADIALVQLKESVTFTSSIQRISLPGASRQFQVGNKCWVTGWGNVDLNKPLQSPQTLQKLDVTIVSKEECNNRYNELKPDPFLGPEAIKSDMICAGYTNSSKGFCNGDSGGPLACQQDGNWYLAGVVSWFMTQGECAASTFPGVYTRVTAYESWINERGAKANGASTSAVTPPAVLMLSTLLLTVL